MAEDRRGLGADAAAITFVVIVLLVLAGLILPFFARARDGGGGGRRTRCRSNLNQLAKGMATYLSEYGDNRWYSFPLGQGLEPDDFDGSEWLASLYWTRILPDPGVFLCPSSFDTNHNGEDLGSSHAVYGRFGSQTVSYAGMHYKSLTDKAGNPRPGAIPDDFPPNEPMASDDTEGTINHGEATNGCMLVLFFDSHVEFWTHTEIDLEHGVGMKGGPLWRLRN
jgi:hypothetical protein